MDTKKEIRLKNKKIRQGLDIQSISKRIAKNLFDSEEYIKAQNIFTYISKKSEISTEQILNDKNKNIFVPKITDNEMFFTKYDKTNLVKNKFGIYETTDNKSFVPKKNDVIIIPALAADLNFYRTGYGGGFYDKFLKNNNGIKIILLPEILLCENLPHESHDVSADMIITENRLIRNNSLLLRQ